MRDPVRIVDLGRDLIELSGLEVGKDMEIVYTGFRPGESRSEELFNSTARYARTKWGLSSTIRSLHMTADARQVAVVGDQHDHAGTDAI